MSPDITTAADIRRMVDCFYQQVLLDPLLGPLFTEVARLDIDSHLPIMYRFWESLLLGANTYNRQAFQPHLDLHLKAPLGQEHFERWLSLFETTVDSLFDGPRAAEAKARAGRIAQTFSLKLEALDRREHMPE